MFALYGLIGAMQALYGPMLPAFGAAFRVKPAAAGLLLSAHFCGAAAGILFSGSLAANAAIRRRLIVAASALLALGYAGLAGAPSWPLALLAVFCVGLGYGTLVITFSQLIVAGFGARNAFMLMLLNAVFGIGSLAGPALVAVMSPSSFRPPFLAGAIAALALLPGALSLSPPCPILPPVRQTPARRGLAGPLVAFAALFFVLGGMESSLGGWEATQLIAQGATAATAATLTALYWGTFTVGRLLAAPLTLSVGPRRIIIVALLCFTVLAGAALIQPFTPVAYTLAGFCLAPLYPLSLVWFARAVPSGGGTRWVMISDLLGGAAVPFLVGQVIALTTAASLAAALVGCAIVSLAIVAVLRIVSARPAAA